MTRDGNPTGDDAAVLARELAERLAAIATPPPGAAATSSGARGNAASGDRAARVSFDGPRALLENGARFVAPSLPAEARFFAAKRLFLRLLRIVTRDQTTFNSAIAEALRSTLVELEGALGGALTAASDAREAAREAAARAGETARRLEAGESALERIERTVEEAGRRADERDERARERVESALADTEARLSERVGAVSRALGEALAREAAARETLERDRDVRFEALARRHEGDDERSLRVEASLAALGEEVRSLKMQWTALRAELREHRPSGEGTAPPRHAEAEPPGAAVPAGVDAGDPLRAGLYFDFERSFRGSEEEIRERQRADVARFLGAPGPVVDLGCGRGEFLELLKDAGIPAVGCDANPIMAARAREKGLDVERADLFAFLEGRADGTLGGVVAYQVVEHLPPARLYDLVELCAAKLAPGGRVLFETVNPESVYAMKWFWMDLTHVRPVPAPSLSQLLLALGFRDVAVDWRSPVPEADAIDAAADPALGAIARLLFAPQDYAVTGLK